MIAVVIPYFQREPGILRRALRSIAAQRDCPLPLHIVVVDDASPAPAASEVEAVASLSWPVEVVVQPNGGPAVARNAGLDRVPSATRYVAFLDSDDEWSEDHLARAVQALDAGHDLYFADHLQLGQSHVGAFERGGRISHLEHPALTDLAAGLHRYQGDMLDQIIRGNVIGTSTVVYRHEKFSDVRFRVEFTSAGEDYLFWMDLVARAARVCFSRQIEATYGSGINVYSGTVWGSERHLVRTHNELRYRKTVQREFALTAAQKEHVMAAISQLRHAYASVLIHRLTHIKRVSLALMLAHLKLDPMSYFQLPAVAWSLITSKR
jgi:succinoglycan biosynthesis protein ExoW